MLEVEEVRDRASLGNYRAPWSELVDRSPTSDIFQTYEWLTSWLDCFWKDRPIRFLFLRERDRLVGVAPLLNDPSGAVGCRNSVALPVNAHVRRLDFLHAGEPRAVLDTVIRHLRRTDPRLRLIFKQNLVSSPIAAQMEDAGRPFWMACSRMALRSSPIIRIDSDWDTFLASRSSHTRSELRRKVRRLERDSKPQWQIVTGLDQCDRAMDDVMAIEENSWKEDHGTSFTAGDGLGRFYRDVARRFAEAGWLKLHLLRIDGKPVAHIFGAEFRREYFAIKTSYDASYREASPGVVLFQYALRDAFERKLTAFDLLGEESRWKNELANDSRPHASLCLFSLLDPQCCWCAVREQAVKPFIKKNVPGLVAFVRRLGSAVTRSPRP